MLAVWKLDYRPPHPADDETVKALGGRRGQAKGPDAAASIRPRPSSLAHRPRRREPIRGRVADVVGEAVEPHGQLLAPQPSPSRVQRRARRRLLTAVGGRR